MLPPNIGKSIWNPSDKLCTSLPPATVLFVPQTQLKPKKRSPVLQSRSGRWREMCEAVSGAESAAQRHGHGPTSPRRTDCGGGGRWHGGPNPLVTCATPQHVLRRSHPLTIPGRQEGVETSGRAEGSPGNAGLLFHPTPGCRGFLELHGNALTGETSQGMALQSQHQCERLKVYS